MLAILLAPIPRRHSRQLACPQALELLRPDSSKLCEIAVNGMQLNHRVTLNL